ncbi:hypothetical protein NGB58_25920 [Escherichia coli]|nr:hypothetical protein [Escherichia coli]
MKLKMINGAVKLGMTLGLSVLCLTSQSGICGQWEDFDGSNLTEKLTIVAEPSLTISEGTHPSTHGQSLTDGELLYAAKLNNNGSTDYKAKYTMIRFGSENVSVQDKTIFAKNSDKSEKIFLTGNGGNWDWFCSEQYTCGYIYRNELAAGTTSEELKLKANGNQKVAPGEYTVGLLAKHWVE